MPPPSKFVMVHNLPIQHPHLLNPAAEAETLNSYNSFVGLTKSKLLAHLTHPRGEIVNKTFCQRFATGQSTVFPDCVVNLKVYPAGYCTACAWATDNYKCRAASFEALGPFTERTRAAYNAALTQAKAGTLEPHHLKCPFGCMLALEHAVSDCPLVSLSHIQHCVTVEFARYEATIEKKGCRD
ncbi:hypothetical protein VC83_04625 [Pseudogymnoascus destructans]|uniref:Uncharacterized protein n=1 Tax=Pseudogymnoascus destructans TaxID=655981 RepID=A0A177A4Z7_9PEZI|nr:uncharacterized protein VC83_04625 [Pseudogymnoascus destructans]OAF57248.1 hypothetical protein VC83_04625 [Pseudogymnoascus destructans]